MATIKRLSRREAYVEQHALLETYVHVYPTFGQTHVVDGFPIRRCWCEPKLDIQEDGTVVTHNVGH